MQFVQKTKPSPFLSKTTGKPATDALLALKMNIFSSQDLVDGPLTRISNAMAC